MPAQVVRFNGYNVLIDAVEATPNPIGTSHVAFNGTRSWVAAVDGSGDPIYKHEFQITITKADQATRDTVAAAVRVKPCPYRHHTGTLYYCYADPGDYKEKAVYAGTADGVAYDITVTLREA